MAHETPFVTGVCCGCRDCTVEGCCGGDDRMIGGFGICANLWGASIRFVPHT